jgi:pantoate--beta-alanine ligase
MNIVSSAKELGFLIQKYKSENKSVSFVPTMGYLHEGHLSLVREAKTKSDIVVLSIFVNPAQFNDKKDYEKYPRNTEEDSKKCESAGLDILFLPDEKEIYPDQNSYKVDIRIPHLMRNLCAVSRPGHFEGVLLVISRLFHIVNPDLAFFGKKDFQQYLIIKYFAKACGFPVEVIGLETIRESDGLAMSSRNARLTENERKASALIFKSLNRGLELAKNKSPIPKIISEMGKVLQESNLIRIDYIEILDSEKLTPKIELKGETLFAIAAFVGEVRLIDNISVVL